MNISTPNIETAKAWAETEARKSFDKPTANRLVLLVLLHYIKRLETAMSAGKTHLDS